LTQSTRAISAISPTSPGREQSGQRYQGGAERHDVRQSAVDERSEDGLGHQARALIDQLKRSLADRDHRGERHDRHDEDRDRHPEN
jgi:hypothetical protein